LYTASGDFQVTSIPLSANNTVEILVVGGGGGGGSIVSGSNLPGGGNGGAVVYVPYSANIGLDLAIYNVNVGNGGLGQTDGGQPEQRRPSSPGQPSYFSGSGIEAYALGGASPGDTFVSQSSLSGLSSTYGHNNPKGTYNVMNCGSPGGGGAGAPGTPASASLCVAGVGGDGYQVETFPFANDYDGRGDNKWGAGGGGNGYGCASCGGSSNGGKGGISGGGSGAPAGDIGQSGWPNTGGGGGGNVGGGLAGSGAAGFVAIRYKIAP